MILNLHVQEEFLDKIREGLKSVEGRLAKDKYKNLVAGDVVVFNETLRCEVVGVNIYPSFKTMIESEGLDKVLPGVLTIDKAVAVYHSFYSPDDENVFGVAAVRIKAL